MHLTVVPIGLWLQMYNVHEVLIYTHLHIHSAMYQNQKHLMLNYQMDFHSQLYQVLHYIGIHLKMEVN